MSLHSSINATLLGLRQSPMSDQRVKCLTATLILIASLFIIDAAPAWSAPPEDALVKPKVVCFGDSITKRGYPQILARLTGVDAINAGVAGNSTAQALRRLSKDALDQKPDVVVVLLGTNDLRVDAAHAYVPVSQYRTNLESIVAKCRKQQARVILCSLPPIQDEAFFTRHERQPFEALGGLAKMIASYRESTRQVAVERSVTLVDLNHLLASEPRWLSKDGVHPSEEGNAIIAKHVADALTPLLANGQGQTQRLGTSATKKPNVVLIMADDMGYEALSVNGSESCQSPNLDRLAADGVRFTNGFAQPLCTPSRAKIMTGLYNVRNYLKFGSLDRGQTTFAHPLKAAGYATCIAGKWQLGREPDSPQHFGFQKSCLWQHTRTGRSKANGKKYDRRFVNPLLEFNSEEKDYVDGEYGPQVCTDFVCDFIDENKDQPFLVYYPMILTHCPFDPTPDSKDYDPNRMGSTTYKGDLNDPQRRFREMVAYADKLVGQIVSQLEKSGVRDNTLLIFTGDNGTDKPIVTRFNGRNVVGGKGAMTDEGTRVPLIVSWPAGIEQTGRVVDDLVEFTDMMPTLCEATGAELPTNYPGDGASFIPVLKNNAGARQKDQVYIWYGGKVMVRNKEYSLLAKSDGSDAKLIRYKGPFEGQRLEDSALSDTEVATKQRFEAKLAALAKTRLSSVSEKARVQLKKTEKRTRRRQK